MNKKIILVFKTHFDLGFTRLFGEVTQDYAGKMLDQVIETCEATQKLGSLKYVWTMPSWPLKLMETRCLPEKRKKIDALIENGQLAWHALPFTSHFDFCGLEDFIRGFQIAKELSEEHGKSIPISAKMTDVPGHGAMLPALLHNAGVKFLHLGSNSFASPPEVPELFFWEAPTGERTLTMYSKGDYGSGLLPPGDWNYPVWMALMHTHDNCGPQSRDIIEKLVSKISREAPGTQIVCGTMDDFYRELEQCDLSGLPVIGKDLADSWIHGVGSYPAQTAGIRQARRRIAGLQQIYAFEKPKFSAEQRARAEREIADVYENLMLFGEHTWGLDVKTCLGADRVYEKEEFLVWKEQDKAKRMELSWKEQAEREENAAAGCDRLDMLLGIPAPVGEQCFRPESEQTDVARLQRSDTETGAAVPETGVLVRDIPEGDVLEGDCYRLEFCPATGTITGLYDKYRGCYLLKERDGMGVFSYRYDRYGTDELTEYLRTYAYRFSDWGINDNGRQEYPECVHEEFAPQFDGCRIEGLRADFFYRGGAAVHKYGDAVRMKLTVQLPERDGFVSVEFSMEDKQETPFIESGTLRFPLAFPRPDYRINKNGYLLDPKHGIAEGANHVFYAAENLVLAEEGGRAVGIAPADTSLIAIGETGVYRYRKNYQENLPIVEANLFNNMWGTNFPQWIGGSCRFRFFVFGTEYETAVKGREAAMQTAAEALDKLAWEWKYKKKLPFELPGGIRVSMLEADSGEGITLRLKNDSEKEKRFSLSWPGRLMHFADLIGRRTGQDAQEQIEIVMPPYGIRSIRSFPL